jgi:hypothetical protein
MSDHLFKIIEQVLSIAMMFGVGFVLWAAIKLLRSLGGK